MERVVVDTNILVSATISPKGNPAKIMMLISYRELQLFYCSQILDEYKKVLAYERLNLFQRIEKCSDSTTKQEHLTAQKTPRRNRLWLFLISEQVIFLPCRPRRRANGKPKRKCARTRTSSHAKRSRLRGSPKGAQHPLSARPCLQGLVCYACPPAGEKTVMPICGRRGFERQKTG